MLRRLLTVALLVGLPSGSQASDAHPLSSGNTSLQARANDPTEPLIQATLQNLFAPSNRGGEGVANALDFQPVIPIPALARFPIGQILRPTFSLVTTPGPDRKTGFGDISFFDIFLPEREPWGSWGIGPVFVFPTASDDRLGQGKWQLGPAAALMYTKIPNLQLGAILQNPISFAGDGDRADVNALLVQPIAQYNLPRGWYVSMGDLEWEFDWEQGGEATIPLAFQVGRVVKLGAQHYNLAVESFYTVAHSGDVPRWGFRLGFTLLLPE